MTEASLPSSCDFGETQVLFSFTPLAPLTPLSVHSQVELRPSWKKLRRLARLSCPMRLRPGDSVTRHKRGSSIFSCYLLLIF